MQKEAQRVALTQTRQTLTVTREDYDQTCKGFEIKMRQSNELEKSDVKYETLEFVKTIFGQGVQKINAFTNTSAQQAFADLGCEVKPKPGKNSTALSFNLGESRVMKFKWDNPHGHGDDNLYNELKPYMRRFLHL